MDGEFCAPQFGIHRRAKAHDDGAGRRSCYTKKRYATEDIATKVMRKRLAEGSSQLRVYNCFRCGGYHLTRRPE